MDMKQGIQYYYCFALQKAKIKETAHRGNVLDLTTTGATADLGDYSGMCIPPDQCRS